MSGPGTELKKLIPKLLKFSGCNCNDYARQMDRWGVKGCQIRRASIVAHLMKQSRKLHGIGKLPASLRDWQAKQWVDKAIERAKNNAKK